MVGYLSVVVVLFYPRIYHPHLELAQSTHIPQYSSHVILSEERALMNKCVFRGSLTQFNSVNDLYIMQAQKRRNAPGIH
jgi:stress response protein YsnF